MADKFTSIDAYVTNFPPETRARLEELRQAVRAAAPDAVEAIAYNIPTLRMGGKNLVHFAGWKKHISLYPVPEQDEALLAELGPYRESKGTLKFPLDQPTPLDLIHRIVAAHLAERAR